MRVAARTLVIAAVAVVVVTVVAGCAGPASSSTTTAAAWPEADLLWTRANTAAPGDFLGGDSAYSVSLGGDRVAWFFGDSFIATDGARSRRHAKMVRNAVAVQTGLDPSSPSTTIAWFVGGDAAGGAPSSFFGAGGDAGAGADAVAVDEQQAWVWPGTPALVDGKLLVFLWHMKATGDGGAFGFALDHTSAVLVDNPGDRPSAWHQRALAVPHNADGFTYGTGAALVDGDTLWLLAAREPGDHAMALAKISVADAAAGDLERIAFVGDAGFTGPTELSLSRTHDGAYAALGAEGFLGALPLAIRTSSSLSPPAFGAPVIVFQPAVRDGAFVYSAKAHPELHAGGALAVTYCTNADLGAVVDDTSLYFPRFVRVTPR